MKTRDACASLHSSLCNTVYYFITKLSRGIFFYAFGFCLLSCFSLVQPIHAFGCYQKERFFLLWFFLLNNDISEMFDARSTHTTLLLLVFTKKKKKGNPETRNPRNIRSKVRSSTKVFH